MRDFAYIYIRKGSMELKDFVRETLLNIVQGVKEAQDVCGISGAIISPRDAGQLGHKVKIKTKPHYVQIVDFQVILGEDRTKETGTTDKGVIGVVLSAVGFGGEVNKSNKQEEGNTAQTCVKFSVPVILPSIDNEEFEIPKVAHSFGHR